MESKQKHRPVSAVWAMLSAVLIATWPAVANAQQVQEYGEGPGWIVWLIAVGIIAAVLAAVFMNPKRSHLD